MDYLGSARDKNTLQANTIDAGQRTPPLVVECQALGEGTELLLKQIEELESRLGPVLSPEPPLTGVNEVGPDVMVSPHVTFLRSRNRLIYLATDRIANILKRIEL